MKGKPGTCGVCEHPQKLDDLEQDTLVRLSREKDGDGDDGKQGVGIWQR